MKIVLLALTSAIAERIETDTHSKNRERSFGLFDQVSQGLGYLSGISAGLSASSSQPAPPANDGMLQNPNGDPANDVMLQTAHRNPAAQPRHPGNNPGNRNLPYNVPNNNPTNIGQNTLHVSSISLGQNPQPQDHAARPASDVIPTPIWPSDPSYGPTSGTRNAAMAKRTRDCCDCAWGMYQYSTQCYPLLQGLNQRSVSGDIIRDVINGIADHCATLVEHGSFKDNCGFDLTPAITTDPGPSSISACADQETYSYSVDGEQFGLKYGIPRPPRNHLPVNIHIPGTNDTPDNPQIGSKYQKYGHLSLNDFSNITEKHPYCIYPAFVDGWKTSPPLPLTHSPTEADMSIPGMKITTNKPLSDGVQPIPIDQLPKLINPEHHTHHPGSEMDMPPFREQIKPTTPAPTRFPTATTAQPTEYSFPTTTTAQPTSAPTTTTTVVVRDDDTLRKCCDCVWGMHQYNTKCKPLRDLIIEERNESAVESRMIVAQGENIINYCESVSTSSFEATCGFMNTDDPMAINVCASEAWYPYKERDDDGRMVQVGPQYGVPRVPEGAHVSDAIVPAMFNVTLEELKPLTSREGYCFYPLMEWNLPAGDADLRLSGSLSNEVANNQTLQSCCDCLWGLWQWENKCEPLTNFISSNNGIARMLNHQKTNIQDHCNGEIQHPQTNLPVPFEQLCGFTPTSSPQSIPTCMNEEWYPYKQKGLQVGPEFGLPHTKGDTPLIPAMYDTSMEQLSPFLEKEGMCFYPLMAWQDTQNGKSAFRGR